MNVGIYNDLSIEEYHSSAGISKSGLMKIAKSPLHYWHEYLNEENQGATRSKDLIIGDMVHTKILEPEKFEDRFCLAPLCDRRTNKGKEEYAQFLIDSAGKSICDFDMSYQVNCMEESFLKNKEAMSILNNASFETSIYWNDFETDLLCKSRPDILGKNYVADLKTSRDISHDSFARDCIAYGYDVQAAMWQMAVHSQTGEMIKDFIFLVIEKTEPFATAIYIMSDEMVHYGRERFRKYLNIYKECLEENEWGGIKPQILELPRWCKL